jgi:hypothetical protein
MDKLAPETADVFEDEAAREPVRRARHLLMSDEFGRSIFRMGYQPLGFGDADDRTVRPLANACARQLPAVPKLSVGHLFPEIDTKGL